MVNEKYEIMMVVP